MSCQNCGESIHYQPEIELWIHLDIRGRGVTKDGFLTCYHQLISMGKDGRHFSTTTPPIAIATPSTAYLIEEMFKIIEALA